MTGRIYCEYLDFGQKGVTPDCLNLVFDDSAGYTVPDTVENSISTIWERLNKSSPQLHDGDLLHLSGTVDDGREIHLSPGNFREFYSIRAIFHNQPLVEEFEVSPEIRDFAQRHIKPLSSVTAVLARDELVVGIKNTDKGSQVTLPGSGYLDGEVDMTDEQHLHPVRDIILREVEEELAIRPASESVRCLGVYSECVEGVCLNPAIFSIVKVSRTPEEVIESFRTAEDSWEFDSVFTVPLTSEALHRMAAGSFNRVPEFPEELLTGSLSNSAKTPLLLGTVGRWKFGESWFANFIDEREIDILRRD